MEIWAGISHKTLTMEGDTGSASWGRLSVCVNRLRTATRKLLVFILPLEIHWTLLVTAGEQLRLRFLVFGQLAPEETSEDLRKSYNMAPTAESQGDWFTTANSSRAEATPSPFHLTFSSSSFVGTPRRPTFKGKNRCTKPGDKSFLIRHL